MISIEQLIPFYPVELHPFREFILREYLQHKILQIIFDDPGSAKRLSFIGGTCLRIVHGSHRFSEDIDFDNTGLTKADFIAISKRILSRLEMEGYSVEIKNVFKNAFHCHIRFPGLLHAQKLSGYKTQKILIQLDTEPQHYAFTPDKRIINKFDIFTEIPTAPLTLLLAQKFYTIINRNRKMGRDFFDIVFLLSKNIRPDYEFLKLKTGISSSLELKERVLRVIENLDMNSLAMDVEPFLFHKSDTNKVKLFNKFIRQVEL